MNVEQLKNKLKNDYDEMNAAVEQKNTKISDSKKCIEKLNNELLKLEEKRKNLIFGTVKSKVSGMFKNVSIETIDNEIASKKQAIIDEEKTLSMLEEIKIYELYDFEKLVSVVGKVSEEQQKIVEDLEVKIFEMQQEYRKLYETYKEEVQHHNSFIGTVKNDITKYLPVKYNEEYVTHLGRVYAPGTYKMLDFESIRELQTIRENGEIPASHRRLL